MVDIEEVKSKKRRRKLKKPVKIFLIIIILIITLKIGKDSFEKYKAKAIVQNNVKNSKIAEIYKDNNTTSNNTNSIKVEFENEKPKKKRKKKEIDDWRLILVNYENQMPSDFEIELANIDKNRQIDERVLPELNKMINAIKKDGITNIWVQSAYRSVSRQQHIYNEKVNMYLDEGKTLEEAEELTQQTINKPETSEHNLGLAIDFNYVDYDFEKSSAYEWLLENAENYGFILRYPKEKVDITKVNYEPWHWRYVGKENAIKMNELDMCLEEYIEYNK